MIFRKVTDISKNYYILLFDEYPSNSIVIKYTKIKNDDLPSFFLKKEGFREVENIFSNFTNTESSTTSLLTGEIESKYTINQTIKALKDNIFTNQKNYLFNSVSIFDDENRKNSLVSFKFFESYNSMLYRYIIPFCLHLFSARGAGLFTNYEDYHKVLLEKLSKITYTESKKITYLHFFTPHNYPLVEEKSLEERILNANKWMKESIRLIRKNDPNSGIIILSDHGLRLNNISRDDWKKNILYYRDVNIDTVSLNKLGLSALFKTIKF